MTYLKLPHPNNSNFLVIGYTTREHLLLDLDDTSKAKAEMLARTLIRQHPKLGDCLVVQSSEKPLATTLRYRPQRRVEPQATRNSHHLIFDNRIGYNSCIRICQTLAALQILERSFLRMRYFRGDMTLRVSPTLMTSGDKPMPRPVAFIVNTKAKRRDGLIWQYLRLLNLSILFFNEQHKQRDSLNPAGNDVAGGLNSVGEASALQTLT